MNRICWCCALALGATLAAEPPGLKPRLDAGSYPVQTESQAVAIGAALLTPEQVRGHFSTDLNRGYLVVEVGMYPKAGGKVDVGPGDFFLRVAGTETESRPAAPRAIAAVLQKTSGGRDITLYPQAGVGYSSGPTIYDPSTGTRGRAGGVNTSVGMGVGIGEDRSASTPADRRVMEQELGDQQLPEKVTTTPVAGYLYFPAPTRKKGVAYELEYDGPAGRMVMALPGSAPFEAPAHTQRKK